MRLLALALLLALGLASEGKRYLFVRYDPEKGVAFLSDGSPLPPGLQAVPGQYVEVKGGRLKPTRAWQPPQDLVKVFAPQNAARVVFSHERHFAALGAKGTTCQTCHALLDRDRAWKSLAPSPSLEPHGPRSLGRFCATCHDGKTRASTLPKASPPVDATIFTAFGRPKDQACARCHAPKDHGQDFTSRHGEVAEHGGGQRCTACHRGAGSVSPEALALARAFQEAQLALIRNPEDGKAFNRVLPNNFCAYCHGLDGKAWERE
ncbi:cytochrome c3 family protein [Thermus sp.]|uniref:cytochrome c3 family protein n=1 Tax=Thermus sp. TaxID=275 RepID=UPI003D0C2181